MSIQHSIDIITTSKFSGKNIINILAKGKKLGFVYKNFSDNPSQKIKILDLENALKFILYPDKKMLENYGRLLIVQHHDVFFDLYFYDLENNKLKFSLANFCDEWKQEFYGSGSAEYGVKYQRFIKTALDLCKDFCIEEIKTEAF